MLLVYTSRPCQKAGAKAITGATMQAAKTHQSRRGRGLRFSKTAVTATPNVRTQATVLVLRTVCPSRTPRESVEAQNAAVTTGARQTQSDGDRPGRSKRSTAEPNSRLTRH